MRRIQLVLECQLRLLYKVTSDVDLTLNAGRAFRAPSLEERFKYIDLGNLSVWAIRR